MAAVVFRRRGERPVPTHGGDSIVVSRSDSESALATIWPPCGAAPLVRREPGRWSARREPRRLLVPASLRPAAAARRHPAVFRGSALPASYKVVTGWRLAHAQDGHFVAPHR